MQRRSDHSNHTFHNASTICTHFTKWWLLRQGSNFLVDELVFVGQPWHKPHNLVPLIAHNALGMHSWVGDGLFWYLVTPHSSNITSMCLTLTSLPIWILLAISLICLRSPSLLATELKFSCPSKGTEFIGWSIVKAQMCSNLIMLTSCWSDSDVKTSFCPFIYPGTRQILWCRLQNYIHSEIRRYTQQHRLQPRDKCPSHPSCQSKHHRP